MKNTHLAIGIASSVALGVVIGILFAPDTGSNTRKKITKRGNGMKNNQQKNIEGDDSSTRKRNEYSLPPKDRDDY